MLPGREETDPQDTRAAAPAGPVAMLLPLPAGVVGWWVPRGAGGGTQGWVGVVVVPCTLSWCR